MTFKYEKLGETLYTDTLDSGLTVNVAVKPDYNKSYAFFAADYGGADRRFRLGGKWMDTPAGVAHFLEHKMFDTPDGGNALNILSANGASPNAFTSAGMTAYFFESTQGFYENLRVLLNFVSVPYFTEESVRKEQGIIGQEIRMMEDSPGFTVYVNLLRCLYENNPIRDSVAGTIESIAQITERTLYDCHKVFYNPSNMTLCVAGDVDPERICQIAREELPQEPGEIPERDYADPESEFPLRRQARASMQVSAPIFAAGGRFLPALKGAGRARQQLVGSIALSCLLGRSSPLFTRLYAQGILNDSFGAELDFAAGTAMIITEGESPDPSRYFSELAAQAAKISSTGLDPRLFSRIKKSAFGKRLRRLDQFDELCREMAEGYFAGWRALDIFDILDEITVDEASAFIADNFKEENLALSVIEPLK